MSARPTLTCAHCGEEFEPDWSEEEAQAEAARNGFDTAECDVVCDPCYQQSPWRDRPEPPPLPSLFVAPVEISMEERVLRIFRQFVSAMYSLAPGILDSRYGARRALHSPRVRTARARFAQHDGVIWQIAQVMADVEAQTERQLRDMFTHVHKIPYTDDGIDALRYLLLGPEPIVPS